MFIRGSLVRIKAGERSVLRAMNTRQELGFESKALEVACIRSNEW